MRMAGYNYQINYKGTSKVIKRIVDRLNHLMETHYQHVERLSPSQIRMLDLFMGWRTFRPVNLFSILCNAWGRRGVMGRSYL